MFRGVREVSGFCARFQASGATLTLNPTPEPLDMLGLRPQDVQAFCSSHDFEVSPRHRGRMA